MVSFYNFELITQQDKEMTVAQSSVTTQTDVMRGYFVVCHMDPIEAGCEPCQSMQACEAPVVQNYYRMQTWTPQTLEPGIQV